MESSRNINIGLRFRIVLFVGLKFKEFFRSKIIVCNWLFCIILFLDNILFFGWMKFWISEFLDYLNVEVLEMKMLLFLRDYGIFLY